MKKLLMAGLIGLLAIPRDSAAGGVTIITHGFNGDVNGWVTGMANAIPNYDTFPGTNFTIYKIAVTFNAGVYSFATTRTNGAPPATTDSGEIVVKFDWSQLAGISPAFSTHDVAWATSQALLQTNLISELGGHALVEWPLHLVGHSRGGSLVCELSRQLGTNGVWIDHLTTLDPHPLNNDGFSDPLGIVDAPAKTYVNVLFHDNYWQNAGDGFFTPIGEPVAGAYVRKLTSFVSGYSSQHSDVHLWYHGTINWNTPASDTEASINANARTNWWTPYETNGMIAGLLYSRIGGGDRLSPDQPVGPGFPAIRDGYNQWWDLGAGTASNRVALTTNYGNWPNLIRFNRATTNQIVPGGTLPVTFYYQWARPNTSNATISVYLDDDLNPLNTNQSLVGQLVVPANGASFVSFATTNLTLTAANASVGNHWVLAKISGGGQTRFLYAPEPVLVVAPPTLMLGIMPLNETQYRIEVDAPAGGTVVLSSSPDLANWLPLVTNVLATNRWFYTNTPPATPPQRFYRGVFAP
jgi:hypothetical protein